VSGIDRATRAVWMRTLGTAVVLAALIAGTMVPDAAHGERRDGKRRRADADRPRVDDSEGRRSRRPNLLLIVADDVGIECLGSYGTTSYATPNLDALARTGVRFANCFGTPLSASSRIELLTGRYPLRFGWKQTLENDPDASLDPRERTIADLMHDAGYRTAYVGAWQLASFEQYPSHVQDCGFDEYLCWGGHLGGDSSSRYWSPKLWRDGHPVPDTDQGYGPDLLNAHLLEFLRRQAGRREQPFFAVYATTLAHAPFLGTPDTSVVSRRGRSDPANYPTMVAYLDKLIGKVTRMLDELGLREETLVLFTSDNGRPRAVLARDEDAPAEALRRGLTDAGTRVPFIANWKGTTPAGLTCEDLVDLTDVAPTLVRLAGGELPERPPLDGHPFAPQLRGRPGEPRQWVYSQLGEARFVRTRRWKLYGDGRLFDILADASERRDLAAEPTPKVAAVRKRLQDVLDELARG
jgi:arylsulfatase A